MSPAADSHVPTCVTAVAPVIGGGQLAGSVASSKVKRVDGGADQLDHLAVMLGLHDPLWSVNRESWASRAAFLFAPHEAQALADPRLEALRQYTVRYRNGLAREFDEAWISKGLTTADLAAARSIVDAHQAGHRS